MDHYSPKDYDVIVGVAPMSGFGEDTFIGLEQNEESFSVVVSADGQVTRVKNHNRTHRLILTLMQNSPSNAVLTALHAADMSADGGAGVVPILVRNKNGSTLLAATAAWVAKQAPISLAKGVQGREWIIDIDAPANFVGT